MISKRGSCCLHLHRKCAVGLRPAANSETCTSRAGFFMLNRG